jgi:hypothetical protein
VILSEGDHGDVWPMAMFFLCCSYRLLYKDKYMTGPASPLRLMWLPLRMASLDKRFSGGVLLSQKWWRSCKRVRMWQNKRITQLSKPPEPRECDALDLHDHPTHSLAKTGEAFQGCCKSPEIHRKGRAFPNWEQAKTYV